MPSPLTDDSILMFRLLADEQWHSYDEVKSTIARQVAPGRAYRRYQGDLEAKREQKGDPTYDTNLSEDDRILYGAKRLAQNTLSKWASKGIIIQTLDGVKRVRLKKDFWPAGLERNSDEHMKGSSRSAGEVTSTPKPTKAAAAPKKAPEPAAVVQDPPPEDPGVGESAKAGVGPSESPLPTAEQAKPRVVRDYDFLTRTLGMGITGPIYTEEPAPEIFHTRPLSMFSGPEEAIAELEAAVPEEYTREDYLKAVEERFPQLVEPEKALEEEIPPESPALVPAMPELPEGSRVVTSLIRCTDCAGLIEDEAAHITWHSEFVKRSEAPDPGLWNESLLREAVRAELAPILDRFQVSMQGYLEEQFVQVTGLITHYRGSGQAWTKMSAEKPQNS